MHAFVSGRVQGVFYRGSLARQAQKQQLRGFVRNLADGRVEYLAFGSAAALEALLHWSRKGPAAAKVLDVEVVEYAGQDDFNDFSIEY